MRFCFSCRAARKRLRGRRVCLPHSRVVRCCLPRTSQAPKPAGHGGTAAAPTADCRVCFFLTPSPAPFTSPQRTVVQCSSCHLRLHSCPFHWPPTKVHIADSSPARTATRPGAPGGADLNEQQRGVRARSADRGPLLLSSSSMSLGSPHRVLRSRKQFGSIGGSGVGGGCCPTPYPPPSSAPLHSFLNPLASFGPLAHSPLSVRLAIQEIPGRKIVK